MMVEYLYVFQIWIIIGLVLIILEAFDTSTIFFLPLGLSSLVMSLWLYLTEIQFFPITWIPAQWFSLVFVWAILGFCFTLLLTILRKLGWYGQKGAHDINEY